MSNREAQHASHRSKAHPSIFSDLQKKKSGMRDELGLHLEENMNDFDNDTLYWGKSKISLRNTCAEI
jgi:hypothetical protein